jgi:CheY-like chemotaxis protein
LAFLVNEASTGGALQRLDTTALPPGLPVLVCSVPGTFETAGNLGVANYLVKPVSRDALLAALDRLDLPVKTILIVDDEPDALRLFRRMLASSGRGYRVLRAKDGQEAIKILRGHRPDAILLDLVMPNMDGFQLLEARSQDPSLSSIPVIILSARDPAGHPIVSKALTITCEGGLSIYRLLACIRTVSEIFSTTGQSADPAPTTAFPG